MTDAFNYGWKKFQENWQPWLLGCVAALAAYFVVFLIYMALLVPIVAVNTTAVETRAGAVTYTTNTGGGIAAGLLSVAFAVALALLGWIISAQFIRAALGTTDRGRIDFSIFLKKELLGVVIVAAVILAAIQFVLGIIGLVPILGWLIQFIGSIVVTFFAQFYAYFVLDQGQAPVDSIKSSFAFVNQHLSNMIVLFLATIVAFFIGALLCGIGLLIAIPVIAMAHAYTYRVLRNEPVTP